MKQKTINKGNYIGSWKQWNEAFNDDNGINVRQYLIMIIA